MIDSGPRLRRLGLWAKRETMFLAILECALQRLSAQTNLPQSECDLNRLFYFCLLEASRELYPRNTLSPVAECNNQPDGNDESRASREHKRPDFQWIYLDLYEQDPKRSSKQFVVECKRLGKARRADWVFNENYVRDGICRFRDPSWAYAQRFPSGAMVGYCREMGAAQALREVNQEARKHALPDIAPNGTAEGSGRLGHEFDRPFEVSPFHLHHLWADLGTP